MKKLLFLVTILTTLIAANAFAEGTETPADATECLSDRSDGKTVDNQNPVEDETNTTVTREGGDTTP